MDEHKKIVGFYSSHIDADENPARLTDDLPCDYVMISVWNTEDDGSDTLKPAGGTNLWDTNAQEIYWGFGNCVHQLFPKESTRLIPVKNAKDIFVRCNKLKGSTTRVAFSCFHLVTVKEETI